MSFQHSQWADHKDQTESEIYTGLTTSFTSFSDTLLNCISGAIDKDAFEFNTIKGDL